MSNAIDSLNKGEKGQQRMQPSSNFSFENVVTQLKPV
jgi:hypothetical protein